MAVERRYNEHGQTLVKDAWEHLSTLMKEGASSLPNGRQIKLTDGECIRLFQWLASFSPPKGAPAPTLTNFTLQETHGKEQA